jgi:hypothetical protein
MRISHFKTRTLACAMLLIMAAFALSASAQAATKTGQTTRGLSAAMIAQLKYNPSGKVISSDQISYDNGDVIVTVGAGPDFRCPDGYVCLYSNTGYTGDPAAVKLPVNRDIKVNGLVPRVESLRNNRENGVFLFTGDLHGKNSVCYVSGQGAPSIPKPTRNFKTLYLQDPGNC